MKIVSIESLQRSPVRHDIEVTGTHNFVACGVVVHNSNFRAANIAKEVEGEAGQAGFHVGSHRMDFVETPENLYWRAARKYKLDEVLPKGYQIFGEVYGRGVQKLTYDLEDIDVRFFDLMVDTAYAGYAEFVEFCVKHFLPMAPLLHVGPWKKELMVMADGKSQIAKHIREGFVVRPVKERWDHKVGRVILKAVSEEYLTSKNSEEIEAH